MHMPQTHIKKDYPAHKIQGNALDTNHSIFSIKHEQIATGVTDLDTVSDHIYELHQAKQAKKMYRYNDICIEKSSDTEVTILQPDGTEFKCILWCVNHYLGLNRHPQVVMKTKAALDEYGTGSGTSAMSGGLSDLHFTLSERMAKMVGKEAAVLYSTGYTANLGAISALTIDNDLLLIDKECHASIVDGCRLSGKKVLPFHHNDVNDLEKKLKRFSKQFTNIIVIVESAYSMSGDLSPLKEIVALKQKCKFFLYVDEAHSFGFYGDKGKGYCYQLGVSDQVDFIMSTLSKATASIGGFVACNAKFSTLLSYYAHAYCFQATMPAANVASTLACLDIIEKNPNLIERLHSQTEYFRNKVQQLGFDTRSSESPIVPIYVKDSSILSSMSDEFIRQGIYMIPVVYPAVSPRDARFRFIVTAAHTKEQIDYTLDVIKNVGKQFGLI